MIVQSIEAGLDEVADARGGATLIARAEATDWRSALDALLARDGEERAIALIAWVGGAPFGCVVVEAVDHADGAHAVVHHLRVDPAARGAGIGRALMSAARVWASDRGCVAIEAGALPGDRPTKNFFESFGLVAREIRVEARLAPRATA